MLINERKREHERMQKVGRSARWPAQVGKPGLRTCESPACASGEARPAQVGKPGMGKWEARWLWLMIRCRWSTFRRGCAMRRVSW